MRFSILIGTVLLAGLLWAQAPGGPPMGGGGRQFGHGERGERGGGGAGIIERMTAELKLTPAQEKKVKALEDSTMKAVKPHDDAMKTKMEAADKELRTAKPNMTKIQQFAEAAAKERVANQMILAKSYVALRGILTKEQIAKLPDMTPFSARRGFGGGMGMGGMHPGGPGGPGGPGAMPQRMGAPPKGRGK